MRARRSVTIAVLVGLLMTVAADISFAAISGSGGGSPASAGASSHPNKNTAQVYAAGVRKAATEVYNAVGPIQVAMDRAIAGNPYHVLAAGDALSHSRGDQGLARAQRILNGLHPAATQVSRQHSLLGAVSRLRTAVRNLKSLGNGTLGQVLEGASGKADTDLVTAEAAWDNAMQAVFATAHQTAPSQLERSSFPGLAPSRATWIYQADNATFAAATKLRPTARLRRETPTPSRLITISTLWNRSLTHLYQQLRGTDRPRGSDALPFLLRQRLGVLRVSAAAWRAEATAMRHRNFPAAERANTRVITSLPGTHALAQALRSYGAVGAATVIDAWAGHRLHITGGHTSARPIQT